MRGRAIALGIALAACHRAEPGAPSEIANDAGNGGASATLGMDAALPARCTLADAGVTLGDVGDRRSLVIGDAVPTSVGFTVGLVHSPAVGVEAIVARVVGHSVESEWIVAKRGELIADAPPPIPLVGPSVLYAAYLTRDADAGLSRRIAMKKLGVAAPIASFKVEAGDSLSFDAALATDATRAALTWDDDAAKDGGIRVAVVPLGAASGGSALADAAVAAASRVVSDGVTDVDAPRLAPRLAGGWWVAWTARREEPFDAGARAEAPSEARAFTWVELVAIDANGAPVGPTRKLTSPTGHVASFDLAARPYGELDVFARDETQAREGEGGKIVHIVAREASVDDAVVVATGAGRAAVDLVTGANGEAWLSFIDAQDRPRILPLGESRAAAAPATTEDVLEGARLLAITSTGSPARFVVAVPASDAPIFREVTCTQ